MKNSLLQASNRIQQVGFPDPFGAGSRSIKEVGVDVVIAGLGAGLRDLSLLESSSSKVTSFAGILRRHHLGYGASFLEQVQETCPVESGNSGFKRDMERQHTRRSARRMHTISINFKVYPGLHCVCAHACAHALYSVYCLK